MFTQTGGFGAWQWFLSVSYWFNNKSIMILILALAYLQKVPKEYFCVYEGSSDPVSCTPADFCDNPNVISFEPNYGLEDTYDNWVQRFNLHCAPKSKIGFISSAFFAGWVFTLIWVPRVSDLFGRQKVLIAGTLINFLAFTFLLLTESYAVLIICMTTFGMMATIRVQVGVNYMYESVRRDQYTTLYSIIAMGEGICGLYATLHFMFISKSYFGLLMVAYVWLGLAAISAFFYPESPRYLIKSGQVDEAGEAFNQAASFNKAELVTDERLEQLFGEQRVGKKQQEESEEKAKLLGDDDKDLEERLDAMTPRTKQVYIKNNVMYFLSQRVILQNLIALTILWVVSAFNFFLCNLMIKYIPGNFQNNMLVMTSTDILGSLVAGILLAYYSPKKLFCSYYLLGGLAGLCMVFLVDKENPNWTVPMLVGLARIGVSCSFVTIYMTHPSYFPTLFAVTSMGIANIVTRVIVIFAPLAAELDYPTPMIIFTLLCFVACTASFFINDEVR